MSRYASSNTILEADEVWTSGVGMRHRYDELVGIVFSDQDGTLKIQFSVDGENWDFEEEVAVSAGTGEAFAQKLWGPYFRLVYTNGSTDQGEFRISVSTQAAGDS